MLVACPAEPKQQSTAKMNKSLRRSCTVSCAAVTAVEFRILKIKNRQCRTTCTTIDVVLVDLGAAFRTYDVL